MGNDLPFETETLESMCELVVDCPHFTPKWTDTGVIVLRNQNIRNGVLDLTSPSFTNDEGYESRIKRAVPRAGDIVITREAPMGEVCIIPEGLKCCLGQRQVLLRPKKEVSSDYLFWALQSHYVKHQISWNEGTGTTVSNIRIPVLKAFNIPRWHEKENKIAHHLSTIADKINLNKKTNQTLEKMAQALFKSWFVDFDPVIDNALAAGTNISDFPEPLQKRAELRKTVQQSVHAKKLPEDIRKLFPSEFEESELGWVPKGWEVGTLSSLTKFSTSRMEGSKLTEDNYISTENMLPNKGGVYKASSVPILKTTPSFSSGHILISNIRPYFKKIWLANSSGGRSNDVLGFEVIEPTTNGYLMNLLYQDHFFDYMMTTSKGSKMPRGDKKAIMEWGVVVPPIQLREFYSKLVGKYYEAIPARIKENNSLVELRNTLLPKLISGELVIESSQLSMEALV